MFGCCRFVVNTKGVPLLPRKPCIVWLHFAGTLDSVGKKVVWRTFCSANVLLSLLCGFILVLWMFLCNCCVENILFYEWSCVIVAWRILFCECSRVLAVWWVRSCSPTEYLKGLTCSSAPPSPDLQQCNQATAVNMQTVVQGRFQTGSIAPSKYMENLCK